MNRQHFFVIALTIFIGAFLASGCTSGPKNNVETYVEGTLKVRTEVDSTGDYSGFRVSVLTQKSGSLDTLGTAITDASGAFKINVSAPEEGIYPLVVERSGAMLSVDDLVVVHGDSARVTGAYPLGPSGLRIVSRENAAWSAYRNAKAGHNAQMLTMIKTQGYSIQDVARITAQTSTILWSIPATYPETIGGNLAMAESIVMMEGWDDAAVLGRLASISVENPSIIEVVRAARRSKARVAGQDSSLALIDYYLSISPEKRHAGLMAEKVIAYADSFQTADAVRTATDLRKNFPESEWAAWAARATYELENLQPGMNAPAFALVDRTGKSLSTASLKGKFVILEFFDPNEQIFRRELESRDGISGALDPRVFATVSISVEPDSVINEALFDGTTHPGQFVWQSAGMESKVVHDFNIQILPTRYLLDPSGQIVAKYSGPGIGNLEQDLVSIVTGLNGITEVPVVKKVN